MAAICRSTIIKESTPLTSEWALRSLRNDHAVYVGIYIPFISEWLRRSAGICKPMILPFYAVCFCIPHCKNLTFNQLGKPVEHEKKPRHLLTVDAGVKGYNIPPDPLTAVEAGALSCMTLVPVNGIGRRPYRELRSDDPSSFQPDGLCR